MTARSPGALLACCIALACTARTTPGPSEGPTSARVAAPAPEQKSWRREVPAPGPRRAAAPYPVAARDTLPNGVSLYALRRPAGTMSLSIAARVGGEDCGPGQSGLAALTLRLMTEATRSRGALELSIAAESLGASVQHDVGREGSSVSLEVLPGDLDAALGLLTEIVLEPRFDRSDVERIQKQWLDDLASERNSPRRLASLAGMRALLGRSTGAPVDGSVPDVERLSREDFVAFHQRHFVPDNLAVIAVGDVTLERLREVASEHLGVLKRQAPAAPPPLDPPPARAPRRLWLIDRPGAVQSAIFVGQRFPRRTEPGYEARQVMNNLLGGLFTSRLNANLREKHGYTYGARSFVLANQRWGAFLAMTSVKTETTADALEQLLLELGALKEGTTRPVTNAELERSRTDLIEHAASSMEHVRRLDGDTVELFVDDLPPDYHARRAARIAAVDLTSVVAEARRLDPRDAVIAVVGDASNIAEPLRARNWSVEGAPAELLE